MITLDGFAIDVFTVTVHRFERFIEATGHVTDAERAGWSFVFAGRLPDDFPRTRTLAGAPWWRQVSGASWREPDGPGSTARPDHPVVHVSYNDALAFCGWAGTRLPTETEWEFAARGGADGTRFPWGDELGTQTCNVFRGRFPHGRAGTVPVDAFAPNDFELHNVFGNVWEWCADPFAPGSFVTRGASYTSQASHNLSARAGWAPGTGMGNLGFRCAG